MIHLVRLFVRNRFRILVVSLVVGLSFGGYFFFLKGSCTGNCKNGFGSKVYWDGKKYVGQWKNGDADGYGVLVGKDQKILYSGQWKEGEQISKETILPKKK
ncbi:hypothetical protein LEP1GSC060_2267 [Leptospira weilii serovar Ranarum str. ICFT]|uniref:MORN repeat protein n=1 Tax=Leptospira weilii serovar Ranarum str. ICFT TaxID=1218598 RepID=N1WFW1_9LEPT|nr:hypothetical protein [Leptospira weilii]EMY76009.1 hypothetical protein LEP1GSC060_2267 [Leptospira weilii serovar Ranarum str. ICFT]